MDGVVEVVVHITVEFINGLAGVLDDVCVADHVRDRQFEVVDQLARAV